MKLTPNHPLRELLLRRLPAPQVERLESAILLEEGVAEQLRAEEFDLLDDYAAGRLDAADRGDVERYVLASPENRESLRVARALIAQRGARKAGRSFWRRRAAPWVTLLVTGLAAGVAGLVFIPRGSVISPSDVAPVPAPVPAPVAAQDTPTLEAPKAVSAPVITLLAEANRGASRPNLHVDAGSAVTRLQVEVPQPQKGRYVVEIEAAGRRVFTGAELIPRQAGDYYFVEVTVPQEALAPGARTITLRAEAAGENTLSRYRWQVHGVLDNAAQKK